MKQRNGSRTKATILAAAQEAFATDGYTHAGIREIASAAGINLSLVQRYFGSKEKLFEAALADALDTSNLFSSEKGAFGTHAVAYFLNEAQSKPNAQPIMILAAADPVARAVTLELLHRHVVKPLAAWLGPPDGEERAARIAVLTGGFFLFWKLLPLQRYAESISPETRCWLETSLQAVVDRTDMPASRVPTLIGSQNRN
jgi:AcrR family transcriptional regulator